MTALLAEQVSEAKYFYSLRSTQREVAFLEGAAVGHGDLPSDAADSSYLERPHSGSNESLHDGAEEIRMTGSHEWPFLPYNDGEVPAAPCTCI